MAITARDRYAQKVWV